MALESRTAKRIKNAVMVAVMIVVVAAAAAFAASLRAPASDPSAVSRVTVERAAGVVNVVRDGIGFTVSDGDELHDGDVVETAAGASATLAVDGRGTLALSENASVSVGIATRSDDEASQVADSASSSGAVATAEQPAVSFEVASGEVFADVSEASASVSVGAPEALSVTAADAAFAFSAPTGSATAQVLGGAATADDGSIVSRGEARAASIRDDGSYDTSSTGLSAASLSDFAIGQARQSIERGRELCFTAEELDAVAAERAAERESATDAADQGEGGAAEADDGSAETAAAAGSADGDSGASAGSESDSGAGASEESSAPESSAFESEPTASGDSVPTCTVEIRCDTILSNMGSLAPGKSAYVPADGTILATTTVELQEGDTAFSVLERVCRERNIQLEYTYTPGFASYYVEGIGNLYEFDCGGQSGWMCKVNGWFPNYGASSYTLSDGDAVVWCYTCAGAGADLGASVG